MNEKFRKKLHTMLLTYYYHNDYLDAKKAADLIKVIHYLADDIQTYNKRAK